ncbi:MAG: DUF1801 domain-containing protein [Candidatus Aminicenantes bacterium]|nr:DUF1801 domain-containing protein [Candidatus Aminicenantes bacterium]
MKQSPAKAKPKRGGPAKSVDAYLAAVPAKERAVLQKLRATIKSAAPKAEEMISYGIPSFKHQGYLAGFAAFMAHLSFFPGATVKAFKEELKDYDTATGTVHFTAAKPLPAALVRKIIKARIKENEARAAKP